MFGLVPMAARLARRASSRWLDDYDAGDSEWPEAPAAVGAVSPTFVGLDHDGAQALLDALYQIDLNELRRGVPPIGAALVGGQLRYIRSDQAEQWLPISQIWANGGGDCEDLACAVAAEATLRGDPCRPVLKRVAPNLSHVLVYREADGGLYDPSITGGMRGPG